MTTKNWWLNVSYSLEHFDLASVDNMITNVLGKRATDSGAGFGARDLHFAYETRVAAELNRQLLERAGLPVPMEITISTPENEDGQN